MGDTKIKRVLKKISPLINGMKKINNNKIADTVLVVKSSGRVIFYPVVDSSIPSISIIKIINSLR